MSMNEDHLKALETFSRFGAPAKVEIVPVVQWLIDADMVSRYIDRSGETLYVISKLGVETLRNAGRYAASPATLHMSRTPQIRPLMIE